MRIVLFVLGLVLGLVMGRMVTLAGDVAFERERGVFLVQALADVVAGMGQGMGWVENVVDEDDLSLN